MRRDTYTAHPASGDYILKCAGITWHILRRTSEDSALSISTGDKTRKTALARLRSLTETAHADGWEADGPELFRQVTRFRR